MAAIDIAGFVADLKDHAVDHGFHVHDERHFVETYSLRQAWEVDLHPEEACGGPLDLHVDAEDVESSLTKLDGQGQSDVAEPDDRDRHRAPSETLFQRHAFSRVFRRPEGRGWGGFRRGRIAKANCASKSRTRSIGRHAFFR